MKYQESIQIRKEVDKSTKILLNCHSRPDADSVGGAQAFRHVLSSRNIQVEVICPDELPNNLNFLLDYGEIKKIDFTNFNFLEWDLLITLDTSDWQRVVGSRDIQKPDIDIIVIDHHKTNTRYGKLNLVDDALGSNCELLYYLFKDWEIDISQVAKPLLTGIIGDTGAFRFPEVDIHTFKTAIELMKYANKDQIIKNLYQSYSLNSVYLWGEILKNIKIDREHKFVWSAIANDIYKKYDSPIGAKSEIADIIFQSIEGTNFGMVIIEENKGYIGVSLRSRSGFDVSAIAQKLNGGGHLWAAAGRVYDKSFEKAVEIILQSAKDAVDDNKKN